MNKKLTKTQIENILILNEELLKIKKSEGRYYRYHKNENKIYQALKSCFFNKDFNALNLFRDKGLFFDVCSTFDKASLLYDFSSYLACDKKAEDNYCENMKLLLNYDFNPNFIHTNDISCLMVSIHSKERFKLLLDYGANPLLMPDPNFTDIIDFIDKMIKNVVNKDIDLTIVDGDISFKYDQVKFERNIENLINNRNYAQAIIQKERLINKLSNFNIRKKAKIL